MTSKEKVSQFKAIPFSHSQERLRKVFYDIGVRQGWWHTDRPMLLAVSGGSDSMALLWMFHTLWHGRCIIAHLNHGIRGESSDKDQRFVEEIAARFTLSIECADYPVPELLQRGESLEDGARRIRYEFLEKTMKKKGAWGVAVAHTSDDSAETFLMNLIRGTGARGLVGVPEKRDSFVRPLLAFSKAFLKEVLEYQGIPWREDLSNRDNTYTRNRVRNCLIPFLQKEFNPRIKEGILGIAEDMKHFRETEEETQAALTSLLRRHVPFTAYACSLQALRSLDEQTRAVFLRGVGARLGLRTLSRDRTNTLCRLVDESSRWCFQWQKAISLFCSFDLVAWIDPDILVQSAGTFSSSYALKEQSGFFEWGNWRFSWKREWASASNYGTMGAVFPKSESIEVFPLSMCGKTIRKREIPEWALSLFPVLCSRQMQWVPYWQESRCGENLQGAVLHFSATALQNIDGKKR